MARTVAEIRDELHHLVDTYCDAVEDAPEEGYPNGHMKNFDRVAMIARINHYIGELKPDDEDDGRTWQQGMVEAAEDVEEAAEKYKQGVIEAHGGEENVPYPLDPVARVWAESQQTVANRYASDG